MAAEPDRPVSEMSEASRLTPGPGARSGGGPPRGPDQGGAGRAGRGFLPGPVPFAADAGRGFGRGPVPHSGFPPRARRRVFPGRPDQVGRARKFTAASVSPCPVADDAVLLVSELATNAILHGGSSGPGGTFKVMVCHLPGRLYIGVTDMGSATAPGVVPDPGLATSGRGLRLLAEIAACWGHERSGRGGRTVWFGLDCP